MVGSNAGLRSRAVPFKRKALMALVLLLATLCLFVANQLGNPNPGGPGDCKTISTKEDFESLLKNPIDGFYKIQATPQVNVIFQFDGQFVKAAMKAIDEQTTTMKIPLEELKIAFTKAGGNFPPLDLGTIVGLALIQYGTTNTLQVEQRQTSFRTFMTPEESQDFLKQVEWRCQ